MKPTLADLTSAAAVQAALDEFSRKGQSGFLSEHGFGRARDYAIRNPRTGEWADSTAIVSVALAYQFFESGSLPPGQFSEESAAAQRLGALGFEVKRIEAVAGADWSREEVALIVADYLAMLTSEMTGQSYNKTARRKQLLTYLPGRTAGSVEFKHANISAVMLELGFHYLRGYKPRSNFQRSLLEEVATQVSRHALIDDVMLSAVQRPAAGAEVSDFSRVKASAPQRRLVAEESRPHYLRAPIKRDYLEREAQNRSLGTAGELFALQFEQWRLRELGAGHLADRVIHASQAEGDGLGYDIRSFEVDGRERFVEVKTTSFGERTPFFVSANEVRFARDFGLQFHLYRVFEFRTAPRLFQLDGPIESHCNLDANLYKASFA